jgi:hypothetical protein
MTQEVLAREAEMKQPRVSAMERPGETQFNLDTLVRLAAAFKVGLIVRFSSYSEMLGWENEFSQDSFDVIGLENDTAFLQEPKTVASSALNFTVVPKQYQNEWSGGVYEALSRGSGSIYGIRGDVRPEPARQGILPRSRSSPSQAL